MRGIIHHQKRGASFDSKVQHTHDQGVNQSENGADLFAEALKFSVCVLFFQHFDGSLLTWNQHMLAQIYLGKASAS